MQSGTIIRPDSLDWSSLQYTETMLISERTAEKSYSFKDYFQERKVTQLRIIFRREITQLRIILRREKLPS